MSETKIQLEEVREAYLELRGQIGRRPGLHKLRARLNGGSFGRLKRLLDQVEAEENGFTTPDKPMPDPVTRLVAQIWDEIDKAADDSFADRCKAFEEAEAQMKAQIHDLEGQRVESQVALTDSESIREQMVAKIQILESDLDEARTRTQEQDALLASRDNIIEQLNARIGEYKDAQVRQAHEHEQARKELNTRIKEAEAAKANLELIHKQDEERQMAQHAAVLETRDKQIAELTGQAKGLEARIEELKSQVAQSREDAERRIEEKAMSDHQVIRLEGQLSQIRSENHQITENISDLLEKLAKSEAALVSSTETITEQKVLLAKHEEANRLQQETIDQLKKELNSKKASPS